MDDQQLWVVGIFGLWFKVGSKIRCSMSTQRSKLESGTSTVLEYKYLVLQLSVALFNTVLEYHLA